MKNILDLLLKQNKIQEEFINKLILDIRTPLRQLSNYTQLIKENPSNFQEKIPYILEIINKTNKLLQTMNWISLNINKKEEIIETESFLKNIINSLLLDSHEILTLNIQSNAKLIKGNKTLLEWVIKELIDNGFKFNSSPLKEIKIYVAAQNNKIIFSLEDNGPGIKSEAGLRVSKIFENDPTHTAAVESGLSLCHQIITKMNGEIWVTPSLNQGSIFYFSIPQNSFSVNQ